jgi:hypothetical protein
MRLGEFIAYGEKRGCTGLWWEKLREWDRWRDRHRWEYNIMMEFREVGCRVMDWIELGQGRDKWRKLVNAVINQPVS